jgi:hypothetical protein
LHIYCITAGLDGSIVGQVEKGEDFVDRIYDIKLEIKDTTDANRPATYTDPHLEIDSEGRLRTKLYDK